MEVKVELAGEDYLNVIGRQTMEIHGLKKLLGEYREKIVLMEQLLENSGRVVEVPPPVVKSS